MTEERIEIPISLIFEESEPLSIIFEEPGDFNVDFGTISIIGTYDEYEGPYVVTPTVNDQILDIDDVCWPLLWFAYNHLCIDCFRMYRCWKYYK